MSNMSDESTAPQPVQIPAPGSTGNNVFIAALAHELRNFIAPIRNAASILRMRNGAELDTRSLSNLLDRQVDAIGKIVDALADADLVSRGKVVLECEPVDVGSVVDEAVTACRTVLNGRNQILHLSLPAARIVLRADRAKLLSAIRAAIGNSSMHTQGGGQLWLELTATANEVHIRLRDNGIGITQSDMPGIFDFFSIEDRLERPWKPEIESSLAVARRLIELHHGRMRVSSEGAGNGREFLISMPLHAEVATAGGRGASSLAVDPAQPAAGAIPAAGNAPIRILIVDDNAAFRESLSAVLRELGHATRAAAGGDEAVRIAREWTPHFAFLDINMPGLNGFELARRFRAEFQQSAMKLVMMSGDGLGEMVMRGAKNAGFDHCVDKLDGTGALAGILNGEARAPTRCK